LLLLKISIIVPFRDRDAHLNIFLLHMHRLLTKQQIDYGIYLIEPIKGITFNRGLLMNIGFIESLKDSQNYWKCFIFHDVDLIPEDERNIYSCPQMPRHMSIDVSTLNYRLLYEELFGGVTAFTREQYVKCNGFSNLFFGWGGEGDLFCIFIFN
jgi:beta-1,4-galactosyltransferase 1